MFPNKIQECKYLTNKITAKIYYSNRLIFQFNGNNVIMPKRIILCRHTECIKIKKNNGSGNINLILC